MKASLLKRVSLSMPRWEWILLSILLVLNLFLKLLGIGDETIYGDEAYSISVSARPLNFIVENFKADQNPPLYFILLHYWIKLTGVNDVSLKLLSVIFIMLCSVFLYFFARKHLSREAAIFTLLLFTFSNGQEFFSREIRGYALSLFLAVISCNLYFNILEKPRKRIAAALAIANLLLLYTHYLTIFIPFLQAVFSFFRYHKNRRGFIFFWISQIAALLVFIPWMGIVIKNMPAEGNFWITQPDWIALKVTVMELLGSSLLRDIFIVLLACMLLTFLAALRFRKILNSMDPWKFLFLFSLTILPTLLTFLISQFIPVFFFKYLLYSVLGLYLVTGYFISCLKLPWFVRSALFFTLLGFGISAYHWIPYKGDDWKKLVPAIVRQQDESTAILVSAPYKTREFAFYYDREAFLNDEKMRGRLEQRNIFAFDNNNINWSMLDSNRFSKILFVQSHHNWYDPDGKLVADILKAGYFPLWEYQRMEGNWHSAKVSCYSRNINTVFKTNLVTQYMPDTEKCDAWVRTHEVLRLTMDTIYHVSTGFELGAHCSQVTGESFFKGRSATYSDQQNPYSYALIDSVKSKSYGKYLSGTMYVQCPDSGCTPSFVVMLEKKGKVIEQHHFDLRPGDGTNTWRPVTVNLEFKKMDRETLLKIYMFNGGSRAYLDEVNLYFADSFF